MSNTKHARHVDAVYAGLDLSKGREWLIGELARRLGSHYGSLVSFKDTAHVLGYSNTNSLHQAFFKGSLSLSIVKVGGKNHTLSSELASHIASLFIAAKPKKVKKKGASHE